MRIGNCLERAEGLQKPAYTRLAYFNSYTSEALFHNKDGLLTDDLKS